MQPDPPEQARPWAQQTAKCPIRRAAGIHMLLGVMPDGLRNGVGHLFGLFLKPPEVRCFGKPRAAGATGARARGHRPQQAARQDVLPHVDAHDADAGAQHFLASRSSRIPVRCYAVRDQHAHAEAPRLSCCLHLGVELLLAEAQAVFHLSRARVHPHGAHMPRCLVQVAGEWDFQCGTTRELCHANGSGARCAMGLCEAIDNLVCSKLLVVPSFRIRTRD
mmetsp:Transcript_98604/g.274375  ORF Transcript_98604/g.274375 Transcript_98604/m.274375 type:complete len:220 (-) Transcript_98604:261-920(-)